MLQLRLFASVAQTLNFSKTAKLSFITQPAVSHNIKKLEAELGATLINRTSYEVSLTAEGEEFLNYASQIISIHAKAEDRIQNMAQGRYGHIQVAVVSSCAHKLCDMLVWLNEKHPDIQVDIDLLEGSGIAHSITNGNHDFYFITKPMLPENSGYSFSIVNCEPLKLFVNSKIAHTIDLNDWSTVESQPFVSVMREDNFLTSLITLICKNRGFKPRIVNRYNRAESVVLSVNAGIGVAILPGELGSFFQLPNVMSFPIPGKDAELTSVFVWKNHMKTAACKIFKDIVLSAFPEPEKP